MSAEDVRKQLAAYGLEERIVTMAPDSMATVHDAAVSLGIEDDQIAKTMAFLVNEKPVLVVMAGEARVDNHKFRDAFHTKAKMIHADELEALVGHPQGGVTPFGIKDGVEVYFDASLHRHEVVYPSAGLPDNAVKVSIQEMENIVKPVRWVDVARESE